MRRSRRGEEKDEEGQETTEWQVIRAAFRDLGIKHSESEAQRRDLVKVVRGKLKAIHATGGIGGELASNYPAARLLGRVVSADITPNCHPHINPQNPT
jgi:hypothetical protein